MKQLITVLVFLFTMVLSSAAQESARPLLDQEVVRNVSVINVEGTEYYNVTVSLKGQTTDKTDAKQYWVKVEIKEGDGNVVWKKTLLPACLYVYQSGQIEVGRKDLVQLIILKSEITEKLVGVIREKEGIYG